MHKSIVKGAYNDSAFDAQVFLLKYPNLNKSFLYQNKQTTKISTKVPMPIKEKLNQSKPISQNINTPWPIKEKPNQSKPISQNTKTSWPIK